MSDLISRQAAIDALIGAHKYGNLYRYRNLQEHHIFGGPNRQLSEEEGLKVYLCISHHIIGPEAVHNNIENMRYLQREGQQVFEKTHTRQEFIEKFGRNYLD